MLLICYYIGTFKKYLRFWKLSVEITSFCFFVKGVISLASDNVKKVLGAESMSKKTISDAKKRCDQIIADAEAYSENSVQIKIQEAEKKCSAMKNENLARIEDFRADMKNECSKQKLLLKKTADENFSAASDIVIDYLLER